LVEFVVLAGIVALVVGFIAGGRTGTVLIAGGAILCSLAGLELAIREPFVLAGAVAVAVMAGLYFLASSLWLPIALAISLVGFVTTAVVLARVFQRRSGRAFKLR
jgi:multisubunit Na+/H+ antiporter MnhF subunit